jgi:hypothetical protein
MYQVPDLYKCITAEARAADELATLLSTAYAEGRLTLRSTTSYPGDNSKQAQQHDERGER